MGCEKISRRSLFAALPLFPAARFLRGQQDPKFSSDVKVVNLFATVRDRKGQIVRDLNKEDFQLDEDDRPQNIQYFTRETNLPLTIGILVDTSGSTRRVLPDERNASYRFLQQVLREDKDLAFLIHFDFDVELLQDLTSSRQKLEKALDLLETGQGRLANRGQNGGGYPGGGGGGYPRGRGGYPGGRRGGGGTCMYDSVLLASDDLMKKQTGRKALILLTDGMDNGSKVTLSTAVESAQRADTLVYSILFEDPEGNFMPMGRQRGWGGGRGMGGENGRKVLEQISRETGGRFFEVTKQQPIYKVFAAIEEDLRNQYSLGYAPDRPEHAGSYRHIHLTTKQKGLVVQTREGYYPS
jgi:VWFA-related protein